MKDFSNIKVMDGYVKKSELRYEIGKQKPQPIDSFFPPQLLR